MTKLNMASPYKKSTIKKIFDFHLRLFDFFLSAFPSKKDIVKSYIVENTVPIVKVDTRYGLLGFYCPNDISVWRARTLMSKEPDTIGWIDDMPEGGVFWDIGANVGVFTLYAAKKGMQVMAFEPVANNYYILNRNILLNGLSGAATAYCIALSEGEQLSFINLSTDAAAGSGSGFGDKADRIQDSQGNDVDVTFSQGVLGIDIDTFISRYKVATPEYIKLDVDGIELQILKGAKTALQGVREVLVEVAANKKQEIHDYMLEQGFEVKSIYEFTKSQETNVVFTRKHSLSEPV